MPWCATCERNWTPTSVGVDGRCRDCGGRVEATPGVDHTPTAVAGPPWHFWVGVTAAGAYLLWRAVEGVILLL